MLGLNLVQHTHFARLAVWVLVYAEVFFGQLIDVGISALLGDFDYTAADFTRDEQTYDVVLDSVGKSSFSRCKNGF